MNVLLPCLRCGQPLPASLFNLGELAACPHCKTSLQAEVFPAAYRPSRESPSGEVIVVEGESSCFYHPQKKATVPCAECGRFLCALCDIQVDGRHLCPPCLETGRKKQTISSLEDKRVLYNRQALVLAVLPLLITGLAAIFLAVRYWKAPKSLVSPQRWAMPVALVLGILQSIVLGLAIVLTLTVKR
jgi:uncharacterized paraquat-inducible protein A